MRILGALGFWVVLKGSWDVVTRVIIKVTILITTYSITSLKVLITLLAKSHDPPSSWLFFNVCCFGGSSLLFGGTSPERRRRSCGYVRSPKS